jgi:hypothetical protein
MWGYIARQKFHSKCLGSEKQNATAPNNKRCFLKQTNFPDVGIAISDALVGMMMKQITSHCVHTAVRNVQQFDVIEFNTRKSR